MTADAAHVAAVLRATAVHQHRGQGQRKWDGTAWMCRCGEWVTDWNRHRATVAAETLTPLIEADLRERVAALHPRIDREAQNLRDGCGTCRQVWPCQTMATLGEPSPDYTAARIAEGTP